MEPLNNLKFFTYYTIWFNQSLYHINVYFNHLNSLSIICYDNQYKIKVILFPKKIYNFNLIESYLNQVLGCYYKKNNFYSSIFYTFDSLDVLIKDSIHYYLCIQFN